MKRKRSEAPAADCGAPAVRIEGLRKKYPRAAEYAVDGISFAVERGEIVGLLGPNGAGKSTTLKCLTGMLPYREGTVEVFGVPVKGDATEAKTKFGFVTDDHAVFSKMTGLEYVAFMADVYGVGRREREERFALLSERFALGGKAGALISSYSHGMKQKICMIGSLIHAPSLWILDEPMLGLDPSSMRSVSEFMKDYAAAGNAVLFSTHNLDAVRRICDRVIVIRGGIIRADMPAECADDGLIAEYYTPEEENE